MTKQHKISSKGQPCNDDPKYNYYECFESHFYKKRKCQYPWNVYPSLNLTVCENFTETEDLILNKERNFGYNRYTFGHSERLATTEMQCPPPCKYTRFHLEYVPWEVGDQNLGIKFKSIQIGFSNFMIVNSKEYYKCDFACIIGQLGGNLGFFLGGSILAAMDFIIECVFKLIQIVGQKQQAK